MSQVKSQEACSRNYCTKFVNCYRGFLHRNRLSTNDKPAYVVPTRLGRNCEFYVPMR